MKNTHRHAEHIERLQHLHHHGRFGGPGSAGFGPGFAGPGFGPGFPFDGMRGPRGRGRANRGDIRAAILSLLNDGASNGYGLIKAIAERTEGSWRPSPGSVYPTLQQLVDEGLISSGGHTSEKGQTAEKDRTSEKDQGRGTEYTLTDEGRAYARDHEEELNRAWEQNPAPSGSTRELFESVGKLMGVLGQYRHGATDEQRSAAAAKVDELRRALYLILAE